MESITARDFRLLTRKNPRWADTLTEPVAIMHYCSMAGEPIQRLSKFIHFVAVDNYGQAASFEDCDALENAACVSHGYISFRGTPITTSAELTVDTPNEERVAADLSYCELLEKAEGIFNGGVNWNGSGIKEFGILEILQAAADKAAISIENCKRLKVLTGYFPGTVHAKGAGIHTVRNFQVGIPDNSGLSADLTGCPLKRTPFEIIQDPRGYPMDVGLRSKLQEILIHEARAKKALKHPPLEI